MKKRVKIKGALIGILAAAGLSVSPAMADGSKAEVGVIITLSGYGSGLGIAIRNGVMLAVKGRDNIEVVVEDERQLCLLFGNKCRVVLPGRQDVEGPIGDG